MNETFIDSPLSELFDYIPASVPINGMASDSREIVDTSDRAMMSLATYLGHCNDSSWFSSPKLGFFIGN